MLPKTFGSEINAFLYNSLLIDCGIGPEEDDEKTCLPHELRREFFETIKAVVISHPHLDHWSLLGSKPAGIPVYASPTTFKFLKFQARHYEPEFQEILRETRLFVPGQTIMGVETFPTIHSTPDTTAFYIREQRTLHLGEFKFSGLEPEDSLRLKHSLYQTGRQGVDVLVLDAQNVETPGWTIGERAVLESLAQLIESIPGRIIIAGFGSNLQRVWGLVKISRALGRPTRFVGSGMKKAAEALNLPVQTGNPSLIFISGCQAEEGSALWYAAKGEGLELRPQDTIIFSSRPIPGKEEKVASLVKDLKKKVGRVVSNDECLTHTSGHASQEDIKLALDLVRPKQVFVRPAEPKVLTKMKEICKEKGLELLEESQEATTIVSLKEGLKKILARRI